MPDQAMPVMGHLAELRRRVFICLIALIAGIAVSFGFYKQIIHVLERAGGHPQLYVFTLTGAIGPVMKISLLGGFILSLPVWVYEFVAFIAPGLTRTERRFLFMLLPGVTFSFAGGVAFAYFVLVPPMVKFLLNFGNGIATAQPSLQSYIDTVTMLMFWMGIAFETPFLMYFLALIGVVKPAFYARFRKYWFVIAFILGAVITPTFDPVNQTLVAGPFIVLYEIGIWLSRLAVRRPRQKTAAQPTRSASGLT